ncbi:MAG: UDP-N-acetylmuramoyl-tripeptide--D-alanyl-D-alanine ligase [Oscillospiraceae bacterium]|jgi:UDP-N-acetylmuramoyl-tripeptide--D-alanyl-D-alanine ligase|nr:UDP-N-acetylmuramoyl-tripeptide--D-alanyl-D-alanine ligase [Oscillospiraceae bacterium]
MIMNYVVAVLFAIAVTYTVLRHMHIFQLGSYKAAAQFKWLRGNLKECLTQALALLFVLCILIFPLPKLAAQIAAIFIFLVGTLANLPRKGAKKPLVYTPRVVRMLVTLCVLTLAAVAVAAATVSLTSFGLSVYAVFYVTTPLLPMLANLINAPIESYIRHWFVKDAKRVLRSCPNLEIIGITGSYGKTSVKYYLTELLSGKFHTLMTPESYNTPMGIAKTLRGELRGTHEVFVCEMGARYVGDIQELCDFVQPRHGIITAVGEQHLETFRSCEAILHEKLALARTVTDGCLFVNGDCEKLRENLPANAVTYGLNPNNNCYAYNIAVTVRGTVFSTSLNNKVMENLQTPLIGAHNVCNLVGAIAMAVALGVTEADIRARLKRLAPPPHRLALTHAGSTTVIDDAYNSNPAGVKAALDTLALFEGCKILVTPGMVELGNAQYDANFRLGQQAAAVCDYVIAVGEKQAPPILAGLAAAAYPDAQTFAAPDFKSAITKAYSIPCGGEKIILLENDLPDNY